MQSQGIAMPLISRLYLTISTIFFFLVSFFPAAQTLVAANPPLSSSFAFQGFDKNHTNLDFDIALYGDAVIHNSDVKIMRKGRVMYKKPIRFLGTKPGFSAYFSFSLSPGKGDLAFSLVPSTSSSSSSSSASASACWIPCCILSVKYVANRIQLHLGGEISITNRHLSTTNLVLLDSGEKLHSWIDYNGETNSLQVRLCKLRDPRPANSSISYPIDLSAVLWRESLLVGISSSTTGTSTSSVYSWSFVVRHGAPYLMHSEPLDPREFMVKSQEIPPITATRGACPLRILFGAASVLLLLLLVALAVLFELSPPMLEKRPVVPLEYPNHPTKCGCGDEKIVLVGEKDTE